ncbi:MAG: hypothetical protein A3H27_18155 [Acidobacteria bacterium RIFCSPLOWO2_02_FULL_59_13]|nr:MAG: hypothetical protein A3H27_18155 [Acidobacteria bacterium RIFCSPLOWO2_02_FULL_59_13]
MVIRKKLSLATALVLLIFSSVLLGVAAEQEISNKAGKNSDDGKKKQTGDSAKGEKAFQTHCEVCHETDSEEVKIGPGLKGLFKKSPHKLPSGKQHEHTMDSIREQILKGSGDMPEMGLVLEPNELDDVIAYLQTL